MGLRLNGTVGENGRNLTEDVLQVQQALNRRMSPTDLRIAVDGRCGSMTLAAIRAFQSGRGSRASGVIGPDSVEAGLLDAGDAGISAARRPLVPKGAAPVASAGSSAKGKVTGRLTGVRPEIVALLEAVAQHYGTDITVTSGKRSIDEQAAAMWKYWKINLDRGRIYSALKGAGEGLRVKLDTAHADGDREEFDTLVTSIAGRLSLHLIGQAVDVAPKSVLTPAMRGALGLYLHILEEKTCWHLDTKGKPKVPEITPEMRATWPKR